MDTKKDEIINPDSEHKYGYQIIQPIAVFNHFQYGNINESGKKIENIILSEAAQLRQKINKNQSQDVSLWLYNSHLRIDDTASKELIADIPLQNIQHARIIWYRAGIKLKIKGGKYRITWGTSANSFFSRQINFIIFAFKGDKRSKLWVGRIKELKKEVKKQIVDTVKEKPVELKATDYAKDKR